MSEASCRLLHHGAAASNNNHAIVWIPSPDDDDDDDGDETSESSSLLIYSSHANLSIARRMPVQVANGSIQQLWKIQETLRAPTVEDEPTAVITCVAAVQPSQKAIVSGWCNGRVHLWQYHEKTTWTSQSLVLPKGRTLTVLDALTIQNQLYLITGSSEGASLYMYTKTDDNVVDAHASQSSVLLTSVICAVKLEHYHDVVLILIGTAAPWHNKIHIYHSPSTSDQAIHSGGALLGHQDWITDFSWRTHRTTTLMASASQDGKIRLWSFATKTDALATQTRSNEEEPASNEEEPALLTDTTDSDDNPKETEEGESKLELIHANTGKVTRVALEALLLGHESAVTSVQWHPNPQPIYGQDWVLISSSMDRSILLWAELEDGIWAPFTRVGSAGGIQGGSIGSSLLGYCRGVLEPRSGRCMVGHAYGGALHVWELQDNLQESRNSMSIEDRAAAMPWKATPCVTGHFEGVTDLCWEAHSGDYLLTVAQDQTCRLWAPAGHQDDDLSPPWLELGRPQVHGYDLSAVTSLSTHRHPHLLVTGADEKELRVFEAPTSTLQVLHAIAGVAVGDDPIDRVERAYIPSLGLTNKASATDGAEEDDMEKDATRIEAPSSPDRVITVPLERDLGAVAIWPESKKLFGHNTELYCLASTTAARTTTVDYSSAVPFDDVLVASSAKARDEAAAGIRIWNVDKGTCLQVLIGHKSTVVTLSFSSSGEFLASSGKDRRLCIWKREGDAFRLMWAKDSAHKRIIWSVHFFPLNDNILTSGSRDGCIRVWKIQGDNAQVLSSFAPFFIRGEGKPDSVTALAFASRPWNWNTNRDIAVLAVGLESGRLELWKVPLMDGTSSAELLLSISDNDCHCATVTKLVWRPLNETRSSDIQFLASSSLDHGCRVFGIRW